MVSSATEAGSYNRGTLIDKIDADGNVIWSKIVMIDNNFVPVNAKINTHGDIVVVGYAYGSDYTDHASIEKISQEGELLSSSEHESTENYRYIDSWTDNNGNTYAVGYSDKNGIYAVYDTECKETIFEITDENGFWVSVVGNDNNAVLTGTFTNPTTGIIDGKAMALSTKDPKTTAWTLNIANDVADSYAYYAVADNDNVILTEYVENNSTMQVVEYSMLLSADGKWKQTIVSDIMDNSSDSFAPTGIYGDAKNFATLSRYALDNYIYMGNVRNFQNTGVSGVKTMKMNDGKEIKSIKFFDISGVELSSRPASGFYITRIVFADGTTKVTKHTAKR